MGMVWEKLEGDGGRFNQNTLYTCMKPSNNNKYE